MGSIQLGFHLGNLGAKRRPTRALFLLTLIFYVVSVSWLPPSCRIPCGVWCDRLRFYTVCVYWRFSTTCPERSSVCSVSVFVQATSGFGSSKIGNGVFTTILFSSILLQEARIPKSSEVVPGAVRGVKKQVKNCFTVIECSSFPR